MPLRRSRRSGGPRPRTLRTRSPRRCTFECRSGTCRRPRCSADRCSTRPLTPAHTHSRRPRYRRSRCRECRRRSLWWASRNPRRLRTPFPSRCRFGCQPGTCRHLRCPRVRRSRKPPTPACRHTLRPRSRRSRCRGRRRRFRRWASRSPRRLRIPFPSRRKPGFLRGNCRCRSSPLVRCSKERSTPASRRSLRPRHRRSRCRDRRHRRRPRASRRPRRPRRRCPSRCRSGFRRDRRLRLRCPPDRCSSSRSNRVRRRSRHRRLHRNRCRCRRRTLRRPARPRRHTARRPSRWRCRFANPLDRSRPPPFPRGRRNTRPSHRACTLAACIRPDSHRAPGERQRRTG
jgi:hypothetical protein